MAAHVFLATTAPPPSGRKPPRGGRPGGPPHPPPPPRGKKPAGGRRPGDPHHLLHARHLERRAVVHARHGPSPHRRAGDHGHIHSREHDVGAVVRLPRRHGDEVDG